MQNGRRIRRREFKIPKIPEEISEPTRMTDETEPPPVPLMQNGRRIRLIDAHHCPGSVMFLLEGSFGSQTHTPTPTPTLYLNLLYFYVWSCHK